ncbi:MAG: hypothetical protein QF473_07470 [Planctomycetota bacterium]|jgi:hypothetical protein|nr:hypothetical protein [Planctomycetota bacterium]
MAKYLLKFAIGIKERVRLLPQARQNLWVLIHESQRWETAAAQPNCHQLYLVRGVIYLGLWAGPWPEERRDLKS